MHGSAAMAEGKSAGIPAPATPASAPKVTPSASAAKVSPFGGWRHRAAQFYSLLILFSLPMFSIPCQKGTCFSPVEVVAVSLFSNGADEAIVKALLYPGLVFSKIEAIVADNEPFSFPDWNNVLKDMNLTMKGHKENRSSLPRFGIVIGSCLCIIGSFLSAFGTNWISACGMLTLLWYIYTLGGVGSDIFALPMFGVAMLCAVVGLLNLEGISRREPVKGADSHSPGVGKGGKQN